MAAPPPSKLDGSQVLQGSFDEANGRLRVDATLSPGGTSEIIIDHADDSIRLGDGTDLVTTTTVGSNVGLDVYIRNTSLPLVLGGINSPTITRIPIVAANTEYSFNISISTKRFKFRAGRLGKIQYAFSSGQSNTNFYTVDKGDQEIVDGLSLNSPITVYFRSDTAGETLEVLSWE
jgi:hypothetical protein